MATSENTGRRKAELIRADQVSPKLRALQDYLHEAISVGEEGLLFASLLADRLVEAFPPAGFLVSYLLTVDSMEGMPEDSGDGSFQLNQFECYKLRTMLPSVAFAVLPEDFAISVVEIRSAQLRQSKLPPAVLEREMQNVSKY